MAFANTSISDIIATTIQNRSGELADNVTNNNALLRKLKARGNVRPFGGGNVILEEIMYTDSSTITTNSYSGYETINVGQNSPISAAQFSITQYAGSVTMSGLEMLQNSGKEAIIDLMEGRTALALRCVRGSDMPDLWVADSTYYGFYVNSLQALQRVNSTGDTTAGAGFPSLKFYGGGMSADVVLGSGINGAVNTAGTTGGATSAHMWALNTNYIFFRPHRDRNFVPIGGERQSVNQDAIVKLIGWAGNITSCGPQFSGVLIA